MTDIEEKQKPVTTELEVEHVVRYTPAQIQHRFETLRGLSQGEMEALNKKTRRIIDWRLMPAMTLMFLMVFTSLNALYWFKLIEDHRTTWIASTFLTLVSWVFKRISTCQILSGTLVFRPFMLAT